MGKGNSWTIGGSIRDCDLLEQNLTVNIRMLKNVSHALTQQSISRKLVYKRRHPFVYGCSTKIYTVALVVITTI